MGAHGDRQRAPRHASAHARGVNDKIERYDLDAAGKQCSEGYYCHDGRGLEQLELGVAEVLGVGDDPFAF